MLKIENRCCHGTGSGKTFNLNIMLGFIQMLLYPLSKLFGGLVDAFPWALVFFVTFKIKILNYYKNLKNKETNLTF